MHTSGPTTSIAPASASISLPSPVECPLLADDEAATPCGGKSDGWVVVGQRLRFFFVFFFGAVVALLLGEDDREAAAPPPADP